MTHHTIERVVNSPHTTRTSHVRRTVWSRVFFFQKKIMAGFIFFSKKNEKILVYHEKRVKSNDKNDKSVICI